MGRLLFLTLALALALPGSAGAVTFVAGEGGGLPPQLQRWADRSRVPTPRTEVTVHTNDWCYAATACANAYERAIGYDVEFYLEPDGSPDPDVDPQEPRGVFLHELGHFYDYVVMGNGRLKSERGLAAKTRLRHRFMRIMGLPGGWRAHANSPHEKFAEAWSMCALWPRYLPGGASGGYDYLPSPDEHRAVCDLIRKAARQKPDRVDPAWRPPRSS